MFLTNARRFRQQFGRAVKQCPIRMRSRKTPSIALWLEALEGRVLLATNTWTSSVGGSWQTPSNWSLDHTPTNSEDVVIPALSGTQTITYSSGASTIQSLTTSDNVALTGGTLDVTGTIQTETSNGQVTLQGATLGDGTIAAGTTFLAQSGTLDGVTINGDFQVDDENDVVVTDGLTLNGTATLGGSGGGNWGSLDFSGSQTLSGTGTVVFTGPGPYNALGMSSGTLTIGSGITVDGQSGYVGYSPQIGGSPSVLNQGTIQADVSGGTITINGAGSQNTGSLEATNGATLYLEGTLTNSATISIDATSELLLSGTLSDGTISSQTGAQIYGGVLDGVTIDGNFQEVGENSVVVTDGLTLNGTATLGGNGGGNWGT